MFTISLHRLRFFAYHGLYAEEKKIGAEFEVDLSVFFSSPEKITALEETVNYEKLFAIVKNEMQKPREILETLAIEITQIIHQHFPQIKKIEISIAKLNPPIIEFSGNIKVKYAREY